MNMKLTYHLKFLGYWHCGSGLSGGAEADDSVIRDAEGLPFVPGKTIKGLLRDAALEMGHFDNDIDEDSVQSLFGHVEMDITDTDREIVRRTHAGSAFFSNAEMLPAERADAIAGLAPYLFDILSSTSIDAETGTAKHQTLRSIEVTVPIVLEGCIEFPGDAREVELILKCLKWVRTAGAHRNRGLGRCAFTVVNE